MSKLSTILSENISYHEDQDDGIDQYIENMEISQQKETGGYKPDPMPRVEDCRELLEMRNKIPEIAANQSLADYYINNLDQLKPDSFIDENDNYIWSDARVC